MVFGVAYQDAAERLLKAAAAAVNACLHSGAAIQQGAANYSKAEAASTLGGGADVLQAPPEPTKITAPGPPATWGKGEPPPVLWALVQSFLDDVWPDGDVAGLRAAAGRWRSFGAALSGMRGPLNASKSLLDGQHLPEGGMIDEALSQIGDCTAKAGDQCGKLARSLDDFANDVEQAQNHIRDLLNRLGSLADLGHDVMLIIEGDAIDEIRKIADDIEAVLHNLGREARAMEQGIKLGMQVVDGLVVKFEKYVRGQLTDFLGDEVGNPIATVFDTWLNANEGVLKGAVGTAMALGDLDPRWFLVDPNGAAATWEGMGKSIWKGSLINGLLNPQEAGQANLQMLKGLLHLDDWSTARPGLGFGENMFDVATLFIPGAGEAGAAADGAGAAARGAEAAADAERAAGRAADGFAGAAGVQTGLADVAKTSGDLTKNLEGISGDLPKIDAPVSGAPVALPAPKRIEPPVESVPRPPDAAPGTSPGATGGPGPAAPEPPGPAGGGPHDPPPAPSGGPHDPAGGQPSGPAPAGGAHEPPPEPSAAAPAPASAGGPHDPLSPLMGGPRESMPMPAGDPHEPVPATAPGSAPAALPAGGPHEPVGVPAGGPYEPVSVPAGGPHDRVPAPLASVPAAAGERLPSTVPQLAEHSPVRAPAAPGGSPAEPASVAAHSPQPSPSFASAAPHSMPSGGRPTELPGGSGSHGPGEGGPAGGRPHGKPPHDGGPHGPGHGGPHSGDSPHGPSDGRTGLHPPGDGSPNQHGNPPGDDGVTGETPDAADGVHGPPTPTKVPGVDYAMPAADAMGLLEHPGAELERLAHGGVPQELLDGYEPLAGRTPAEFEREFTVKDASGDTKWDWEVQAPNNGFAGDPLPTDRIPNNLRLDRLGSNGGGFLSPEGIPLPQRATPPGLAAQYHVFEGTGAPVPPDKDWVVLHGPAKDAFGQPGGGEQWVVVDGDTLEPISVEELKRNGMIVEPPVPRPPRAPSALTESEPPE